MGVLSDKMDAWALGLCTLGLTALSTFVLWGVLSSTLGGLLAFGFTYGTLAGSWTSLWTGFVRPIASTYLFLNHFDLIDFMSSRFFRGGREPIDVALRVPHALSRYWKYPLYTDIYRTPQWQ